jgi:hypothetical protein
LLLLLLFLLLLLSDASWRGQARAVKGLAGEADDGAPWEAGEAVSLKFFLFKVSSREALFVVLLPPLLLSTHLPQQLSSLSLVPPDDRGDLVYVVNVQHLFDDEPLKGRERVEQGRRVL